MNELSFRAATEDDTSSPTFTGSGPGVQTLDGCSVELYRQLPYFGELDAVRAFLERGASVLELGCGTGRHTRVLLGEGLAVTAVDASAEMLAHVPAPARTLCSAIEDLALPDRFDVVLLASCLINHPDARTRGEFVACAARHLRPGGRMLLERHDPVWLLEAPVGLVGSTGPATLFVEEVHRSGRLVDMSLRYEIGSSTWHQRFAALALGDDDVQALLAAHGFAQVSWHGPRARWAAACLNLRHAS